EFFVHTDADLLPARLLAVDAEIPDDLPIHVIEGSDLGAGWRGSPPPPDLQEVGRLWITEGRTAILSVPSAIVPEERHYLLNPVHADFRRIRAGKSRGFSFDPRMWK